MLRDEALKQINYFKQAAIDAYNLQHNTQYDPALFDIYSIDPNQNTEYAYRLTTKRQDDYLTLEVYCYKGPYTRFHPYEIVGDISPVNDSVETIFYGYAMVDKLYPIVVRIIVTENGNSAILSEDGSPLIPEN